MGGADVLHVVPVEVGLRLKRKVAGWDDDFLASLIAA
jgi:hypothetical protein